MAGERKEGEIRAVPHNPVQKVQFGGELWKVQLLQLVVARYGRPFNQLAHRETTVLVTACSVCRNCRDQHALAKRAREVLHVSAVVLSIKCNIVPHIILGPISTFVINHRHRMAVKSTESTSSPIVLAYLALHVVVLVYWTVLEYTLGSSRYSVVPARYLQRQTHSRDGWLSASSFLDTFLPSY